jgi:hypothetical protein
MSVVGTFLDIVRKAEILLEDGFELVEDVDKKSVLLKVYKRVLVLNIFLNILPFLFCMTIYYLWLRRR